MIQSTAKEAIKGIDWEGRVIDTIIDKRSVLQLLSQFLKPLQLGAFPAIEDSIGMWITEHLKQLVAWSQDMAQQSLAKKTPVI